MLSMNIPIIPGAAPSKDRGNVAARMVQSGRVLSQVRTEVRAPKRSRLALLASVALTAAAALPGASRANEDAVRIGVLMGFTGAIESLTPDMAASAELAFAEVSASGLFLGGRTIEPVRGDSTCTDSAAARVAAERLVAAEQVAAILGADCSGVTAAVVANVAVPNGVVSLSPSATSPALSELEDEGLFFRVAPSDARQGEVLAELVLNRGILAIAVTYSNTDYGKGLSEAFSKAYVKGGGTVLANVAHEDGKADYSADVATLAASGAEHLVVIGYVDQGGSQIIRAALDTGAFNRFVLSDGMIGDSLMAAFGDEIAGSFGTTPGAEGPNTSRFEEMSRAAGIAGNGPYRAESYDSAAILSLAIQAAGSADRSAIAGKILEVANAPGVPIGPGEIAEGLRILAEGGDVDYVGASNVEMTEIGDSNGTYREVEVQSSAFQTIAIW
jgi:branched-chain amino acid transport system substrate-binding protein